MPALNDKSARQAIKILCVGKSGHGKTCSAAPLALLGYKLYSLDYDKGIDTLINLLDDEEHFPYAGYIKRHSIDLGQSSFITIDQAMTVGETERVSKDPKSGRVIKTEKVTTLKPANAGAFTDTVKTLMDWNDSGRRLGNIYSWGPDVVFILDTVGTMARFGYYYHQGLNGRLGAVEDGYDHQRDVGGAQTWVRRIIEVLFSGAVKCNVIVFTHIDWIDESKGFAQSPQERVRDGDSLNLEGVPTIIGQALGPKAPKYFNNVFCIEMSGSGSSVERRIWTVPVRKIVCKRSAWLKDSYSTTTGMAEIFSQLSGTPLPEGFLEELGQKKDELKPILEPVPIRTASATRPAPLKIGG